MLASDTHAPADSLPRQDARHALRASILRPALLTIAAAIALGLVGGLFRLSVQYGTAWFEGICAQLRGMPPASGFGLLFLLVSMSTLVAIFLVRRFAPSAAGSGIQRVEAIWRQELPPDGNPAFLPVKFVSGLLALSSGYALGREGPIVQMGAYLGGQFSRFCRSAADQRLMIAGLSGAGLAVAFSAPLGGVLFTLEELTRSARTRLVMLSMLACAVAVPVAQLLVGTGEIFPVARIAQPGLPALLLIFLLGSLSGLLGVSYNAATLRCLDGFSRRRPLAVGWRALIASSLLSLLLWHMPHSAGSGEVLVMNLLDSEQLLGGLAALWLVRFALGPLSYSLGMSGGLFAPMLAVGAAQGLLFGLLVNRLWPQAELNMTLCALSGMAALFSACIRAPFTGIVLIIEMTGLGNQAITLLIACIPATVIPFLLGRQSMYDELRERLPGRQKLPEKS